MRSDCRKVRELLVLRADDWNARERQQVEAHLETCPECATLAQAYAEQDHLIRTAPRVRLTMSQRDQLLSRIQQEGRRHNMYTRLLTVLGTAVAALALIALGLGLYGLFQGQDEKNNGLSVSTRVLAVTPTAAPESTAAPSILFRGPASGPTEPVTDVQGSLVAPATAIFADEVRVRGLTIQTSGGNPVSFALEQSDTGDVVPRATLFVPADIRLTLEWAVIKSPSADWRVFVHLVDEMGGLILQSDVQVDWSEQTCTQIEQGTECFITTQHEWGMPVNLPPGFYTIRVGLYDPVTGTRAPLTSPTEEPTTAALAQILVPESWIFAGEIRSLDAGSPIPFTIGEPDPLNPSGPGKLVAGAAGRFLLDWQVIASPSADWHIFVHLVNEAGEIAFQSDLDLDWPDGPCPENEVGPECTVTTGHDWSLPADLPTGLYTILAGLYDPQTGRRAPVTSPAEFTPPQIELGQVLVLSSPSVPEPMLVTLLIFSGRPNPVWTLTPAQETELNERLQNLPATEPPFDETRGLGYSGFALVLPNAAAGAPQLVDVWNGVVRMEKDGQVAFYADQNRALELWLFEQAASHLDSEIFNQVRREFWPDLPLASTGTPVGGTERLGEFAVYLTAEDFSPPLFSQVELDAVDLEARPVLTVEDILRYSNETHEMVLTSAAIERLNQLSVSTAGRAFVVTVGDERVYGGAFWTPASSLIFDGVVIQIPPMSDSVRIQLGYPESLDLFRGQDPRSDPRVLTSLDQAGVLE